MPMYIFRFVKFVTANKVKGHSCKNMSTKSDWSLIKFVTVHKFYRPSFLISISTNSMLLFLLILIARGFVWCDSRKFMERYEIFKWIDSIIKNNDNVFPFSWIQNRRLFIFRIVGQHILLFGSRWLCFWIVWIHVVEKFENTSYSLGLVCKYNKDHVLFYLTVNNSWGNCEL